MCSTTDVLAPTGNVGIGTTSPTHSLNVVGDINATGLIYSVDGYTIGSTQSQFIFQDSNQLRIGTSGMGIDNFILTSRSGSNMTIDSSGNVGIGTTSPGYKLHVADNPSNSEIVRISGSGTAGTYLNFDETGTKAYLIGIDDGDNKFKIRENSVTGDAVLVIDTDGNVGIGTTSPQTLLNVVDGDINISGGNLIVAPTNKIYLDGEGDTYLSEPGDDSIGISNGVADNFYFTLNSLNKEWSTNANAEMEINRYGYANSWTQFRDLSIYNGKNGVISFFDGSSGNVGIGTTQPNQTLDVHGNAQAYTFITSSDRDLKDNIVEITTNPFTATPKLYSYQLKEETPVYEIVGNETIQVDTEIQLQPVQVGLMQDEVPEQCRKGNGIDMYCMLSITYVKIAELEAEIDILKGA